MPRAGQRPYECVRRAWHSERHHPIRGSLIQEIFRMANDVHSSDTRKNREWQEKLPIVVLKAEEIIYSKANSEVEYSDFSTLWGRVNNAINTIIRSDGSTENGELLQPCIEAALHLGCTPRRSSRSQRNESPRCYLIPPPDTPNAPSVFPSNSNHALYGGNHATNTGPFMLNYSQYLTHFNKDLGGSCDNHLRVGNCSNSERLPMLVPNLVSGNSHVISVQTDASTNKWPVYPLYYKNKVQPDGSKLYTLKLSNSISNVVEADERGLQQGHDAFNFPENHISDESHETKCDLMLRLGSSRANEERNGSSSACVKRRKLESCFSV